MAITKKIFPDYFLPAYNNIISVVDSDNKNEDDFRFIFDVFDADTSERIARVKLPAAPSGFGVFDAHRILENQVSSEILPSITGITEVSNPFFNYDIKFGEEFKYVWNFDDNIFGSGRVGFTSATQVHYYVSGDTVLITQAASGATNPQYDGVHTVYQVIDDYSFIIDLPVGANTPAEAGTAVYSDFRKTQFTGLTATTTNVIWDGAIGHQEFRNYVAGDYYSEALYGTAFQISSYSETLDGVRFNVIPAPTEPIVIGDTIYVNSGPYAGNHNVIAPTTAFSTVIYTDTTFTINGAAAPGVTLANVTGTSLTTKLLTNVPINWEVDTDSSAYVLAHQTDGGDAFTYLRFDLSDGTTHRITAAADYNSVALPVGPYNINNSALGNIITSDIVRYSAYTEDASSAITSNVLVFDVYEKCGPYTQYQLIFKDRLGSFIPFNFDLVSTKTVNINRDSYKKIQGSYNSSTNTWGYNSYDRGKTVFNVEAMEQIKVTSNWITEANAAYLEELFTSPDVYHIDADGNWLPVVVMDSSFRHKYRNVEKLINYELTFEYAFNDIIQR